ncbi:hypothetical protein [Sinisalibacter aestuarii]|nr:hypothetical protein [Sinisalibacter aestuarii]
MADQKAKIFSNGNIFSHVLAFFRDPCAFGTGGGPDPALAGKHPLKPRIL